MRGDAPTSQGRRLRRIAAIVGFAVMLVLGTAASASAATPSDVYVNSASTAGGTCLSPLTTGPDRACPTVQAGVSAPPVDVTGGTHVHVAAGTYTEQVRIAYPVTLTGAGPDDTIIRSPTTATGLNPRTHGDFLVPGANNYPVVWADTNVADVNINDLQVAGVQNGPVAGGTVFYGIAFVGANGAISNVKVTGIRKATIDTADTGYAIYARSSNPLPATALTIQNTTISDYEKTGIMVSKNYKTPNIDNNLIIGGAGLTLPLPVAQNGILLDSMISAAQVTRNDISKQRFTTLPCSADLTNVANVQAAAIRLNAAAAGTAVGTSLTTGNTVSDSDVGVYDHNASGGTSIIGNKFTGSRCASVYANSGILTASQNSVTGFGPGAQLDVGFAIDSVTGLHPHADLTGNTITLTSTGILLDAAAGTIDPEITAHFNNIVNNPNSNGIGLNNKSPQSTAAFLDVTNNWWGCNEGPGSSPECDNVTKTGSGGLPDYNPWLKLRTSATPETIIAGQTSTIKADLTQNSDGVTPPGVNDFAAGALATFGPPSVGTITGSPAPFSAGIATATLNTTPAQAGTGVVPVKVANETVNQTVIVLKSGRCSNLLQPPQKATSNADSLNGTIAGDSISGLGGTDQIKTFEGDDCLIGGPGADRLLGGTGKDNLKGNDGDDRINGQAKKDKISAGSGNDKVFSKDGTKDTVNCGNGIDSVKADRKDTVSTNCEHVSRV